MKMTQPSPFGSGFLVIDKAQGWTSFDVVAKLRGILKERTIGHLGTLDPLATGVLVVAVGRSATKRIAAHMKLDKDYAVEVELGRSSLTYDLEGPFEETAFDLKTLTAEQVGRELASFWGVSLQLPPAFSAKKIAGRKAYELARAGKVVELKPVEVQMQPLGEPEFFPVGQVPFEASPFAHLRFSVQVSSGTYIRSLAHDLGQKLRCGGLLSGLRRTRVGSFTLSQALTLDQVTALIEKGEPLPFS